MSSNDNKMQKRLAQERGHTQAGWLNSDHTFSFGDYFDENHTGYGVLRVINEDRIAGGSGFGLHPHKDMEIITYIISGALAHKDSLGNLGVISRDEVQVMSAGTGIQHSEYNHLKDEETHFLQIWILPQSKAIAPRYVQQSFKDDFLQKNFVLVVSKEGREGSLCINQDVDLYIGRLKALEEINFNLRFGRRMWMQMIDGTIEVNGIWVQAGDGLSIVNESVIRIVSKSSSEFMVFDLP